MKRLLLLTTLAVLVASTAGCQLGERIRNWRCWGSPQPAATTVFDPCCDVPVCGEAYVMPGATMGMPVLPGPAMSPAPLAPLSPTR